jgi:hypothetical protein
MSTIEGIRKLGFRKWYERQLVEGHLYLVTFVLALVMMAAGYEVMTLEQTAFALLFDGAIVFGGAILAWVSWRGYAAKMMIAEHVGGQASCPGCNHYGFRPVPESEAGATDATGRPPQLLAGCRRCGTRWPIDPGG